MSKFPSLDWFLELKERANGDRDFQTAARWFKGTIGWKINGEGYSLKISGGRIEAVESPLKDTLFTMAGTLRDWSELLSQGTINRLFRQRKIQIEGDQIEAIRYWKLLWYLTEVARSTR